MNGPLPYVQCKQNVLNLLLNKNISFFSSFLLFLTLNQSTRMHQFSGNFLNSFGILKYNSTCMYRKVDVNSPLVLIERTNQWNRERERNVLFNDALNTFYVRLYGVRHMVKDHSDSEKGNPLPPHRLLLSINSKGSFICTIPQTG